MNPNKPLVEYSVTLALLSIIRLHEIQCAVLSDLDLQFIFLKSWFMRGNGQMDRQLWTVLMLALEHSTADRPLHCMERVVCARAWQWPCERLRWPPGHDYHIMRQTIWPACPCLPILSVPSDLNSFFFFERTLWTPTNLYIRWRSWTDHMHGHGPNHIRQLEAQMELAPSPLHATRAWGGAEGTTLVTSWTHVSWPSYY
jgi:hypothetical protein